MDSHQGAGYAFDMNMDFSNVFATKPNEGETSNGFFFGDEGIDTTASIMDPILFPQQTAFDMQQSLSLDNTSGSASSAWNGQLTPEMQNTLNTFSPTPSQSFDTMYQPNFSTALGKRPLQLDVQDFPQAKRLETADYTSTSLFSPLPSSTTTWDAQITPASSIAVGLSDEAADMCAMWFNKYAILPSDRHIDSLSQLTGESADAIRHWFGRLMKQGMNTGQADSAYKSQTGVTGLHTDQFWDENLQTHLPHDDVLSTFRDLVQMPQLPVEESTQESITSDVSGEHETTTARQTANALRGGKKSRCTPTDDVSLLGRDPSKIFQCTRRCGKRYGRKCDWKRNEEEGYPCKSWVCSLCTNAGVENVKPCFRKYHFAQHFRNIHPGVSCDTYEEASVVSSETEFPRRCGFCKHRFTSRQERIDHIAEHFKQGKCMLDWNDGDGSNDSNDSDNGDDRPSDDDSDNSRSAHQPPPRDPRGGSNTKYYGSGGDTGGNGSGGAQGGYFQFQLSQLSGGETGRECYYAQLQPTSQTSVLQDTQQRQRCSSEPIHQRSIDVRSSHSELDAPKGDHPHALAGDALSRPLNGQGDAVTSTGLAQHELLRQHQPAGGSKVAKVVGSANKESVGVKPDWLDVLLKSRQPMTTSALTKKAVRAEPPAGSKSQVWEVAKATSAAPMFFSHTKFDANGTSDPAAAGNRSLQSGGVTTSESKALQAIPMNAQSFLSVRYLGSGGFSTVDEVVHRGTNLRLGRKTLKNRGPAAIQDLLEEVSVLQKLRHPHVIRFLGAYSQGDKMSILLSPIADTTLSLWLDRFSSEKPANFSQVITKMFGCLASSVRYLHEQRPVVKHLDIKPQNVLIVEGDGEFPHVVLCDFGISTADDVSAQLSRPLTRQYVAPEVFKAASRKAAADIWSLGCVFAEMASLSFGDTNEKWLSLRNEFSGRSGKYYWQDIAGLQDRLTTVLGNATTVTETTVVRTLKAMLRSQPSARPDAAALTLVFTPAPCCLSWPNDNATYPGPREELSSVEMLVHEDGVDCNAQLYQHTKITTANSQGLENAKQWLEQCSHSHEVCSHSTPDDARTLPSRLLDVQSDGGESRLRIVETAGMEPQLGSVDYIALSHTWSESQATLTTTNLQAMTTSIPLSALSGTLRTAVTSAQHLGYRYIWTDSLCVIQNSEDDKRAECANMASVFRNAALTLVLDSIDAGLSDFRASLSSSQSAFSWDTRTWSLQERLLSRRFLHLGQEQMYWECNSLKASETFPQGLPLLVWEKAHSKPDTVLENSIANANITATVAAVTDKQTSALQRNRLRNAQWIRKEGDAIGDSMEVGTTSLKVNDTYVSAPSIVNDKLGNFPVFTTSTCGDGNARPTGKDPAVLQPSYKASMHGSFCDPGDASPPLSSTSEGRSEAESNESRIEESGRQEIRVSGQLDQFGHRSGENGNGDGNVDGDVSGVNANGNAREGVTETNTGRMEGVSFLV